MSQATAMLALARPLPPKCDYHPTFLRVRFRVILSEHSERRILCFGTPGEILRRCAPQNDIVEVICHLHLKVHLGVILSEHSERKFVFQHTWRDSSALRTSE